jgi:hypothetical protein
MTALLRFLRVPFLDHPWCSTASQIMAWYETANDHRGRLPGKGLPPSAVHDPSPIQPEGGPMTKLERLYTEYGQSPWLDNLTRGYRHDGTLARMVAEGIRGVTANPTIFTKAIVGSADYDEQFSALTAAGYPIEDAY